MVQRNYNWLITDIVAWDSSSTLIISKDRKIINDFRLKFPLSENLETYNES